MSGDGQSRGRARGGRLYLIAGALPLLASCSSSSSVEYATDAFPSQSLVDLLKASKDSPPAASNVPPPAPAATGASPSAAPSALPPLGEPPRVSATAAANPPPPPTTSTDTDDAVAAAFPSVSLIDLVTGAHKPGSQ